jgi:hypothetical protein
MRRLDNGDIGAAWEDIVARLTDLGDAPSPASTPHQIAASVDQTMVPLAVVYGRAIYGPETGTNPDHVATATTSLAATRARLVTRHSVPQRMIAAYRPASIMPSRATKALGRLRPNGNGVNGNGSRRNGESSRG